MQNGVEPSREEQTLEVLVVLFLIVPSILLSAFVREATRVPFVLLATSTLFRDLALVALILFFLWRNGEAPARIGWTSRALATNVGLGALLFPLVLVGISLLDAVLRGLGLSGPGPTTQALPLPRGNAELALALVLVLVVAISEETIFRGYLIARLSAVTSSPAVAVVLSTVIFAAGHGYEGSAGVVAVGAMGLIFALLYVSTRSLVAPTVIHFFNNFVALVLLPALGTP